MGVVEEMVCVGVAELGKGATSEGEKYLFSAANVWSILLMPLVARCLETIDVCMWHMFVV